MQILNSKRIELSSLQRAMLWTTTLFFVGFSFAPWLGAVLGGLVGGYFAGKEKDAILACLPAVHLLIFFTVAIHLLSPLGIERWGILLGSLFLLEVSAILGTQLTRYRQLALIPTQTTP